jgi:hypothetical protein
LKLVMSANGARQGVAVAPASAQDSSRCGTGPWPLGEGSIRDQSNLRGNVGNGAVDQPRFAGWARDCPPARMTRPGHDEAVAPVPPVRPRVEDFGLTDADLKRRTVRDVLLAEELASVIMVVGTVLAIWRFGWWGIAVACAGLGALYLVSRGLDGWLTGGIDKARATYHEAMEAYDRALNIHDAAMDAWETRNAEDDSSTSSN